MLTVAGGMGLSFLAGTLSTLSPCVLPLLPILIGSAVANDRRGPLALALGLGLSFTLAGVALASLGLYLGFDQGWIQRAAAAMLVIFGVMLVSRRVESRFALATAGLSRAGDALVQRIEIGGFGGQFALGLVLGLVWAPCVGPTLGAAVTLASQRQRLGEVTLVMLVFGIGAALPLAVLGTVSRRTMLRCRGKLQTLGSSGKHLFGIMMIVLGIAVLSGADKAVEARLVQWSPAWLTDLTTRY
ncbi:MAG: cytochrome c biogenesis CcdA family protein [Betaproteobacteria bacterium]